MKRLLIAGALALASAGSAYAADLPPAAAPPPRAPATYVPTTEPTYNWSGIYIGVNGGYGFGDSTWTAPSTCTTTCSTGSFNLDGFLVGGTVGANFQASQLVFGIEADGDYSTVKGSSSSTNPACGSCQTSNEWLGTVRGRLGFAADRLLVFVSGGAAFGDVDATTTGTGGGSNDTTKVGWTGGGGIEYAITDNLTAKIEYLYVDLGSGSCTSACGGGNVGVSFDESIVRAGLNLKFGGM